MATLTEPASHALVSELNLFQYIELLRRRWLLVALCGVIGGILALSASYFSPKTYTTSVELAIVRTGSVVNFDPKFRTVSDNDPNAQALDQVTRRRSLVSIGDTPAFAASVIQKLGTQLPVELRDPYEMQRHISVSNDGDIIRTYVSGDSPETIALIANTWADLYQTHVNETYSENALSTDGLLTQASEAKATYAAREAEVTTFIQTSPLERLRRDTDTVSTKLNTLSALDSKLSALETDAQSLHNLVSRGTGDVTASDSLTALLMQVNTFNNLSDAPLRFDVPVGGFPATTTRAQQLEQIDNLLKTIQERRSSLAGPARDDLYAQLNTLQAQVEQVQAKRKELEAARDLAWNTYQLLNTKVAENTVATQTTSQLVRLATPAIAPAEPINTRRWVYAVIGGLVGLVVGSVLAVVVPAR